MAYSKSYKSKEEKQKELETLIKTINDRVEKYTISPESLKEYLTFMSKFYNYSFNNSMLIESQFSGAQAVGSYAFWQEKGFQVNKGEKGIKILVPTKLGNRFENKNGEIKLVSKATNEEKLLIEKGALTFIKGITCFKQGYVFDVSQTNAKASDLPKVFPNKWLEGAVENYHTLYNGMVKIADKIDVKIIDPKQELGMAKGVSYTFSKEVALNPRNSELQNVKTLLHELTHAKLHTSENLSKYSLPEKEFQAELVAFSVCSYFGIDTSEYSLNYLNNWTKNTKLDDKKSLIKEVKNTSQEFIEVLEETLILEKTISKASHKEIQNEKVFDYKIEVSHNNFNSELIKLNEKSLAIETLPESEKKELWKQIRDHEKWLKTKGIEGNKLDFRNKDLSGMKFLKVDLRLADLRGANLSNCVIYGDLRSTDFTNAKIDGTKFIGSVIKDVKIEANKFEIIKYQLEENKERHNLKMSRLPTVKGLELER